MTCRIAFIFLCLFLGEGPGLSQVTPEQSSFGLDSPDPSRLRHQVAELDKHQQTAAIAALHSLLADTTLAYRVRDFNIARRQEAGREVHPENEYRNALDRIAPVIQLAQQVVRRLEFRRDTGIHCAFDLPDIALNQLATQGAVVMPWVSNEMYEWYDESYPFVTTDLVYHTFMILVRAAFDELENQSFSAEMVGLTEPWAASCLELARDLPGPDAELSRDNAALLAVGVILASGGDMQAVDRFGLDPVRRSHVEAEVARVREASYLGASPLLGQEEDYTEYRVRGRASGEKGADYFRARQWLSRVLFSVNDVRATRRALLLTEALARRDEAWRRWVRLDAQASLLVGPRDDLDVRLYRRLAEELTGENGEAALRQVREDCALFAQFRDRCRSQAPPRINDRFNMARNDVLGLRLLAPRRSADGVLLQRLAEDAPWPISGLQVMAGLFDIPGEGLLLGRAGRSLPASAASVRADSLGLMSGFRLCHEVLFESPDGMPALFRSPLWRDKQVNACLGAWAESRHAAAPYLKSAHIYSGLSMPQPKLQGYVEPYPRFYRRLKTETEKWDELCRTAGVYALVAKDLSVSPQEHRLDEGRLPEFMEILDRLVLIAEAELDGAPPAQEDSAFLKSLGTRLRHLCFNHSSSNVAEEPMSRVVDVATEYQSGQVLEVGVGRAHGIFVAVTHGDETVVCRGSVYGYRELTVPLALRLDDRVWQGLSSDTVLFGKGPWLAIHSPLYFQPRLVFDDLEPLLAQATQNSRNPRTVPWASPTRGRDPVYPWEGVVADPAAIPGLLGLAVQEDLPLDQWRYLARELSRYGGQAEVLAFWRRRIDGILQMGHPWRGRPEEMIGLSLGLQVLAKHGEASDLPRLEALGRAMDLEFREPGSSFSVRPAFSWLMDLAQLQCGESHRLISR